MPKGLYPGLRRGALPPLATSLRRGLSGQASERLCYTPSVRSMLFTLGVLALLDEGRIAAVVDRPP